MVTHGEIMINYFENNTIRVNINVFFFLQIRKFFKVKGCIFSVQHNDMPIMLALYMGSIYILCVNLC